MNSFEEEARRHHPLPAVQTSNTSLGAADSITAMRAQRDRDRIFAAIRGQGTEGFTDEEGSQATWIGPSTYRPRRIELVRAGLIRDSGETRATASGRSAVVWIAADLPDSTAPRDQAA